MTVVEIIDDRFVSIRQIPAATGVFARPSLYRFGVHPALDRGEMAHDVAECEPAGLMRPFDLIGRYALHDSSRSLANALPVLEERADRIDFHRAAVIALR